MSAAGRSPAGTPVLSVQAPAGRHAVPATPTLGPPAAAPRCEGPRPATPPRERLPAGTVDCHAHVFEDPSRWPLVEPRTYTPAPAPLEAYVAMCRTLGITRTVQVSASVYGDDNALTLHVIEAFGREHARGVAGLGAMPDAAGLRRLHEGGMRGVRLSTHVQGYGGVDRLTELGPLLAPLGWHVQLHVDRIDEFDALKPRLLAAPLPLVFDHVGCARGRDGTASAGFRAMLDVLTRRDDAWVKLSSWYRRSHRGAPDYEDMRPLVQAVVEARADRVVWGSNWPHPNLFEAAAVPDDGHLVDRFQAWVPDAQLRHAILVDNPARLYGFAPME